MPQFENPAD